ncbi:beta-lactamase family protein [Actinocorallia sp. API 0066]|uniref:serine hydrolase domain-containing protein n=1 Tax=Actinocorallia sp. API 0066 TaxID=2896846 RepID=UPI001E53B1FD|nr:serine hydrolase domain-containing protein [Actinocorallia sp. API 0066]MCD0449852.1 beta-lactamase family protein [Actinocorallia sp. API 0066]
MALVWGRRGMAAGLVLLLAVQGCGDATDARRVPVTASPTAGQVDAAVAGRIDHAVTEVMGEASVPGVMVGLWKEGSAPYIRAFGVADKADNAPMLPEMFMRIGSVTKTFTVTAVLKLVDEGRIGLDAPISDYVDGVPNGKSITVRQLAGMRSGLFNYTDDENWLTAMMADPEAEWTPRRLLSYGFAHPAVFAPGERFQYSNTNIILLGLAVEKVTGQRLADYLAAEVIEPEGLKNTSLPADAALPEPHAHGYTMQDDGSSDDTGRIVDATAWNPSWAWSAGAMISTLEDLRVWTRSLAEGTLLKPETQAQRLAPGPTGVQGLSYGLGIFDVNGWIGHNGSLPGYQTVAVHLPEQDATLVVLATTDIPHNNQQVSTLLAEAVTTIATPTHIYTLPTEQSSAPPSPEPATPTSESAPPTP